MIPVESIAASAPSGVSPSGLDAIESRIRQIEAMMRSLESSGSVEPAAGSIPEKPKPFKTYLQPDASGLEDLPAGVRFAPAVSKKSALKARFEAFQPLVEKFCRMHKVDKDLINAVIRQESGFNPTAVSKAGARGLMQLMPATARGLGVTDPTNPEQNLEAGIRHLRHLLDSFNGNVPLALAAYNAGPGAVRRYKGVPPYRETQHYVRNILTMFLGAKNAQGQNQG